MQSTHFSIKTTVLILALSGLVTSAQELVPIDATWRYNQSGADLGTAWRQRTFDDTGAGWEEGQALLAAETAAYPEPFRTQLIAPNQNGPITVYFRTHFNNPGPAMSAVPMILTNYIDDGATFYLNGTLIGSIRAPANPLFNTLASGGPAVEGQRDFLLVTNNLLSGDNVLAVEVHQSAADSSDVVFGSQVTMARPFITAQPESQTVVAGSRVTNTVEALGFGLVYRWYRDGVIIPGATARSYVIASAQAIHAGTYSATVSNVYGVATSSNAVLAVFEDVFGPEIRYAVAEVPTTNVINLEFTESITDTRNPDATMLATNKNNYRVTAVGSTVELPIDLVQAGGSRARLTLGTNLMAGTNYVLTINNLEDYLGNVMAPNTRITIAVFEPYLDIGAGWKNFDIIADIIEPGRCPPLTGDDWKAFDYDDSDPVCWVDLPAIFYYGDALFVGSTSLCGGSFGDRLDFLVNHVTYHFRTRFVAPTNSGSGLLRLRYVVDDGAVIYLNGEEIRRINMPGGTITPSTRASTAVGTTVACTLVTPDILVANLRSGTNVLAVEVHQAAPDGADIAFGLSVEAAISGALPEPKVNITSPANGTVFTGPPITITANASDDDGMVTNVQFFAGTTLIGTDTTAPYSVIWTNATFTSHTLRAVARDNSGLATTSAPVSITVAQRPTVDITSPTSGATFAVGENITVNANATAPGSSVLNVEFFANETSLGTDTSAPYSATWNNAPAGDHVLTAVVTAGSGLQATSTVVMITVQMRTPPTVNITSPTNGAVVPSEPLTITATASDADGTIAQVEFFAGATSLGTDTTSPYSVTWDQPTAGAVVLSAVARDNHSLMATSPPVNITVEQVCELRLSITTMPDNRVQLTWDCPGMLQSAPTLIGSSLTNSTWTDLTSNSPYSAPADGQQRFYRLRK